MQVDHMFDYEVLTWKVKGDYNCQIIVVAWRELAAVKFDVV